MQSKRVHWFENDVQFLLKLWKRHISELRLNKRNKHVYDVMATKMNSNDMNFTAEEIRTKIKNLTKRFRLVYIICSLFEDYSYKLLITCYINSAEQKILAAGRVSDGWQFYIPIENVLNQFGRHRQRANKVKSPSISKDEYVDEEELVYPLDVEVSVIFLFRDYRYSFLSYSLDKI